MKLDKKASAKLFKKDGLSILFIGDYLEVRVAKRRFENGSAIQQANSIACTASFSDIQHKKSRDANDHDHFMFLSPANIETFPTAVRDEADVKVLCYEAGDIFIDSTEVVVDWRAASTLNAELFSGRLDENPYSMIADMTVDAFIMNDVDTGIPISFIEGYVAESCRDPNNLSKKFRLTKNFDPRSSNFKFIALKDHPGYTSDGATMLFEGFHKSLASRLSNPGLNSEAPIDKHMYRTKPEQDPNHEYY